MERAAVSAPERVMATFLPAQPGSMKPGARPPGPPEEERRSPSGAPVKGRVVPKSTFNFRAELDLSEIDGRGRPGPTWTGRSCELSRSHLTFRSRRMCYQGREVVIAVHLVDDRPVALYGVIAKSDYDGDALYRTQINLLPMPEGEPLKDWVEGVHPRTA